MTPRAGVDARPVDRPAVDVREPVDAALPAVDAGGDAAPAEDAPADAAPPADTAPPTDTAPPADAAPPDPPPPDDPNGPALYWKFDEMGLPLALDSSGSGFHGTLVGLTGLPQPSSLVPPVLFEDPVSLAFAANARQAVQLAPLPPRLAPNTELTVMAWYRAAAVDVAGAELVSAGDSYLLRLQPGQVVFAKRVVAAWRQCRIATAAHLDGAWHHLAGVTGPGVFRIYLDGVAAGCVVGDNETIVYDLGTDLWVGRHGDPAGLNHEGFDFEGNIDEVRIYPRALNDLEIAALARGAPLP